MRILSATAVMLGVLVACGPGGAADAGGTVDDVGQADGVGRGVISEPPASQPTSPDAAHDLLDRLETAADDLRDFSADITYLLWDAMLERKETRVGEIVYDVRPDDGSRRFAILVTSVIVGNRKDNQNKRYVFDGSWFVEIDEDVRMFTKRQIVAPGERFDPLKLGEGPFPLPVGQRRDDVLRRFEASILESTGDETLARYLDGKSVEGLKLVPRPGTTQAEEITDVEIFYDSATLLPLGIVLTETNGDRKTVMLRHLKLNEGIDESKLSIEEPDKTQWQIDVRPWRE